jgi:hypothetical protein
MRSNPHTGIQACCVRNPADPDPVYFPDPTGIERLLPVKIKSIFPVKIKIAAVKLPLFDMDICSVLLLQHQGPHRVKPNTFSAFDALIRINGRRSITFLKQGANGADSDGWTRMVLRTSALLDQIAMSFFSFFSASPFPSFERPNILISFYLSPGLL